MAPRIYQIRPARPALALEALCCLKVCQIGQLGFACDDHACFFHQGYRYTVVQRRPGRYHVYDDSRKRVLAIGLARRQHGCVGTRATVEFDGL